MSRDIDDFYRKTWTWSRGNQVMWAALGASSQLRARRRYVRAISNSIWTSERGFMLAGGEASSYTEKRYLDFECQSDVLYPELARHVYANARFLDTISAEEIQMMDAEEALSGNKYAQGGLNYVWRAPTRVTKAALDVWVKNVQQARLLDELLVLDAQVAGVIDTLNKRR